MDFLGIGAGEIAIILVIALLIFGPDRLVEVARTLGRISSKISRAGREFSKTIQQEADLSKEAKELKDAGREFARTVQQEASSISKEVRSAGSDVVKAIQQEATTFSKEVAGAGRELTGIMKQVTDPPSETKKGNPPDEQSRQTESATGGQPR